jgi:hypothetical protein
MKKLIRFCMVLSMVATLSGLAFAAKGMFTAKAGEKIFVCACGEGCKCGTLGKKNGECGCGQKMVEATVSKVEKGKVFYKVGDKEFSAPQKGTFECGCGEGCNCGFVSQKKGTCGCGQDMVKVKK